MIKDRIKFLRKSNKLSQEELANKLELSRTAISAYELGRNEPSAEILKKMAKIFNVPVSYIIEEETSLFDVIIPKEFIVLARKIGDIPEEDKVVLFKIFDSTIDKFLEKNKKRKGAKA